MDGELADLVAEAQDFENTTHTDTFKVVRFDPDDPGTYDPVTGETVRSSTTVFESIMGRLRSPSASERQATAGEHQWSMSDVIWRIAADAIGIQLKDVVTCIESPQGVNVGGEFIVVFALTGSHTSSARFIVRRVDA